jgi:hypothetical protein
MVKLAPPGENVTVGHAVVVPVPHVRDWLSWIVTTVVWLGDVRVPVSGVTVTR